MPRPIAPISILLSCALGAHASESVKPDTKPSPASAEPAITQVEVKGSTAEYDARRDDTASKTVITQEEILKYGDTSIFDVLKRAPGVTVIGDSIQMRGLGDGYTRVLINGEEPPPGFTLEALPTEQIERIEIMRAAIAEHSMQAIAGTINVVLKQVVAKPERSLQTSFTRSDRERSAYMVGTLADRKGGLSYYLNATLGRALNRQHGHGSDQFSAPDGAIVQLRDTSNHNRNAFTTVGLYPRVNWKLSDDHQLNLSGYTQLSRSNNAGQQEISNRAGSFPHPDYVRHLNQGDDTVQLTGTEINWIAKLGGGKLDAELSLTGGRMDGDMSMLSSTEGKTVQLQRDQHNISRVRHTSSKGKYTRGVLDGHALAVGWEAVQLTMADDTSRLEGFVGAPAQRIIEHYNPRVRRLALYGQDEWNVSPHWSVYLGARWQTIRTESRGSAMPSTVSTNDVLSPVAQTLYKFPDKSGRQLRMALTRTFKAADTRQLSARRYEAALNTRFTPDRSGNPGLRPELANGMDLTYEHFFAEGALFSLGGSVRSMHDHIRDHLGQDSTGRWLIRPANEGKAEVRTLDMELKFPLKAVSKQEQAPPLDLRFSVNRNWSKVSSVPGPDNRLAVQTPLTATMGFAYKGDTFNAGASFAYRDGGLVRVSQAQFEWRQRHRELEAYALFKVRQGLDLRLAAGNVLGEDERTRSRYVDASGSNETWLRRPASPSLQLNLEMKF